MNYAIIRNANYKNLGEKYILSAKVHMDESTPHLHIVFIPVIHKLDSKSGKQIDKIACSEYWKGKDSYKQLQDNFYNYIIDIEQHHLFLLLLLMNNILLANYMFHSRGDNAKNLSTSPLPCFV